MVEIKKKSTLKMHDAAIDGSSEPLQTAPLQTHFPLFYIASSNSERPFAPRKTVRFEKASSLERERELSSHASSSSSSNSRRRKEIFFEGRKSHAKKRAENLEYLSFSLSPWCGLYEFTMSLARERERERESDFSAC